MKSENKLLEMRRHLSTDVGSYLIVLVNWAVWTSRMMVRSELCSMSLSRSGYLLIALQIAGEV